LRILVDELLGHVVERSGEQFVVARVRVSVDDRRDLRLRVLVQLGRSADDSGVDTRRSGNRGGKAMAQHIRVDRAEDGRTERAAQCPEEGHARRGDAEVAIVDDFCTMMVNTCMHRLMPIPSTSMSSAIDQNGVAEVRRDSRNKLMAMMNEPATGNTL